MTSIEAQKYVKEAFKITWDLGYSPRTRREIAHLIASIPENLTLPYLLHLLQQCLPMKFSDRIHNFKKMKRIAQFR